MTTRDPHRPCTAPPCTKHPWSDGPGQRRLPGRQEWMPCVPDSSERAENPVQPSSVDQLLSFLSQFVCYLKRGVFHSISTYQSSSRRDSSGPCAHRAILVTFSLAIRPHGYWKCQQSEASLVPIGSSSTASTAMSQSMCTSSVVGASASSGLSQSHFPPITGFLHMNSTGFVA